MKKKTKTIQKTEKNKKDIKNIEETLKNEKNIKNIKETLKNEKNIKNIEENSNYQSSEVKQKTSECGSNLLKSTDSRYWKTFIIILNHFFIYQILLNSFIFLIIRIVIFFLKKESAIIDKAFILKRLLPFIVIIFALVKIFIHKTMAWGFFIIFFIEIYMSLVIICNSLGGSQHPIKNPNFTNIIISILFFLLCWLVINMPLIFFDFYKNFWECY